MLLNEIQGLFKDAMLSHPRVLDNPDSALADLFEEGDIPLPARLKVYRNNIVGSLTDILAATFPLILKLVGKDFFDAMARSFILAHPPKSGCLSHYGDGFDVFIQNFKSAESLPYLSDIARFEMALNDAYYAKDDKALEANALSSITPEDLGEARLAFRDAVRLIKSNYPLIAIRDFCGNDDPEARLNLDQGGINLMIYRPSLDVETVILSNDEYAMLQALQDKALGEALGETMTKYPSFDFQTFLQKHITLGTFRRFS